MCIIVFSLLERSSYPFILVANRDEFFDRPTETASFWPDYPFILAGRDNSRGGTWIGVTKSGRFAAVTNYRRPLHFIETCEKSRGDLPLDFLKGDETPLNYVHRIAKDKHLYGGFNILVGDLKNLDKNGVCWFSNLTEAPVHLSPGQLYAVSNALLDSPWPKLLKAKENLKNHLSLLDEKIIQNNDKSEPHKENTLLTENSESSNSESKETIPQVEKPAINPIDWTLLFSVLSSSRTYSPEEGRPNTGLGEPVETLCSSIFVNTPPETNYGTRCTTVIVLDKNQNLTFMERSFDEKRNFKDGKYEFKIV
eukprot:TRINITY_DN2217_c0_g1_i10.p1 TRINITY_DN2217_c0_g1~~TRINITY_DN2217_c0_g1_i10.p1  ORF type:complete len:309 (+),score=54.36 TRINITY_DN2217_c0_g1_i10:228-1154(+)